MFFWLFNEFEVFVSKILFGVPLKGHFFSRGRKVGVVLEEKEGKWHSFQT
jgi:hypothetical protein